MAHGFEDNRRGEDRLVLEMAFQERLVAFDGVTGLQGLPVERSLVEKHERRLLGKHERDLLAGVTLGGRFRFRAGDFGVEEFVELAERADFPKLLIFDPQLEDLLDGENDFEQGQRVETDVLDEACILIGLGQFYRRCGRLVAIENPEDDQGDGIEIAGLAITDGGLDRFGAASSQSFLEVGQIVLG